MPNVVDFALDSQYGGPVMNIREGRNISIAAAPNSVFASLFLTTTTS